MNTVNLYLAQMRFVRGNYSEWMPLIDYPGGRHVGVTPVLQEAQNMVMCRKEDIMSPFRTPQNEEYRIIRMTIPFEVV